MKASRADALRWARILASLLLDGAVVYAAFAIRALTWYRGSLGQEGFAHIPERWWRWGSAADLLLFGPDAGNWAANARLLAQGAAPDINRMPVYGWATVAMSRSFDDLVFAGHLVNHLASLLCCLAIYALGRLSSGRGPALLAAVLVAASPALINSQQLYGVDPTLNLAVLVLVLAGWWALRGPWWGVLLVGLAGGVCAGTHYLGLLFPLPVALLLLLSDGSWRRKLLAPVAMLSLSWLVFAGLTWNYPPFSPSQAFSVYTEGVVGSHDRPELVGSGIGTAIGLVVEALRGSPQSAMQWGLGQWLGGPVGWVGLQLLFGLGLLGFGLPPGAPLRFSWDWRFSVWLLVLLTPLLLLEGAHAPERYRFYALPLLALGIARGVGVLGAVVDLGLRRAGARVPWLLHWPAGGLALLACAILAWTWVEPMKTRWPGIPPMEEGLHERRVGSLVAENFPAGGGVVTPLQAIPFFAGRERCPTVSCPSEGEGALEACKELLRTRCAGSGPLPYILDKRSSYGFADAPNPVLDGWVSESFTPLGMVRSEGRSTWVYAIDRQTLR